MVRKVNNKSKDMLLIYINLLHRLTEQLIIAFVDHAISRVSWPCFFLNSVESCRFPRNGRLMHGLQSGIFTVFYAIL